MALTTKISIVSVNRNGKVITVKDSTGVYNADTNPGGYGTPNPATGVFDRVIFTLNNYGRADTLKSYAYSDQKAVISAASILSGTNADINSYSLAITGEGIDLIAFADGVIDVNMYTILAASIIVTGTIGTKMITATTSGAFSTIFSLPSVIIDGKVYHIDRSKTNTNTVLYLIEPLTSTALTVSGAYQANTKALVLANGEKCLVGKIGIVAESNNCEDQQVIAQLTQLLMFKFAAQIDFDCKNYAKANDLALAVVNYCDEAACGQEGGCGCS